MVPKVSPKPPKVFSPQLFFIFVLFSIVSSFTPQNLPKAPSWLILAWKVSPKPSQSLPGSTLAHPGSILGHLGSILAHLGSPKSPQTYGLIPRGSQRPPEAQK